MKTFNLCVLPIIGSVTAVLAFSTSYLVAVFRGDVYPYWPYISDTGTTVPESCIFGELLTITAILALIVIFIRYKWIESLDQQDKRTNKLNIVALVIGIISCAGMTFVANFQETNIRAVHMPSSSVTFGFAIIYNTMHAIITLRTSPTYSSFFVWILRLVLSILGIIAFGTLYGFGIGAVAQGKPWFGNDSAKRLDWRPEDPGWGLHLVSTISEWVIGLTVVLYFLTFCKEFTKIKLNIRVTAAQCNENASDDDVRPLWLHDQRDN